MKKLSAISKNLGYLLLAGLWMVPIYYLVVVTLKTPEEVVSSPLGLPKKLILSNYVKAFTTMNFPRAFMNNLFILVFSVLFIILLSSMAAYVISRSNRKIYKLMYNIFIVGLIIPFQIAIIPLYKLMTNLHLMNTRSGVVVVNIFCINLAFALFLFRGFMCTVPRELEEAAAIDGCGVLRTFFGIVFPVLKPIIATVSILVSLSVWNQFFTPLLFIQDPKKAVLLQEVAKNVGPFSTDWTSFFPMLVLSVLPLVIIYLFLQKNIIDGVAAGSVKG